MGLLDLLKIFVSTIKDSKNITTKGIIKIFSFTVVLSSVIVGSLQYLDVKYASAEVTLIMQKSISNLEKQFELNLVREEISDCKKEMREYRKEFGYTLQRASQFDKENYNELLDKLNELKKQYDFLKSKQ